MQKYINDMKEMFKQITKTIIKTFSPKQKVQKLMTDISGGWYMEKNDKGLPALKISKLSINHQRSRMKFKIYI